MRTKYLFFVLLPLLLWGCGKSVYIPGQKVHFRATSPEVKTRTAYEGTVSGGWERINWVSEEDVLRIYCAETPEKSADYEVGTVTDLSAKSSQADIREVGAPLTWGSEDPHTFYGMYPSPQAFASDDPDRAAFSITNERAEWMIPATQTVTRVGETSDFAPDMRYATMLAKKVGSQSDETVNIPFYPMFNAFKISISAGDNDELHVTSFTLTEGGEDGVTAGHIFTAATMDSEENTAYPLDAEKIAFVEGSTPSATVTVDFTTLTGGSLVLTRDGGAVSFTVFTLPVNLKAVDLTFDSEETGIVRLALKEKNGPYLQFGRCKKFYLTGMTFPHAETITVTGSEINWNGTVGEDLYWQGAEAENINWRN